MTPELLAFWREWTSSEPRELFSDFHFTPALQAALPPGWEGSDRPVSISGAWKGSDSREGRDWLEKVRRFAPTSSDVIVELPYCELRRQNDLPTRHGLGHYIKSGNFADITPEVIGDFAEAMASDAMPPAAMLLVRQGGDQRRTQRGDGLHRRPGPVPLRGQR